ncbi:MAG: cation:H+ antiporter [Phycisphaerales bacterium]|jgi:cation:H+ antiporter
MLMLILILQIVVGLVLLVLGAEFLVRGAGRLARLFGLSPFAIGVTVVAFGTSAPELFATVRAALAGAGDLGVGNVVGSNIANVLLILGLTSILSPIKVERSVMNRDLPIMLGVALVGAGMLYMGDRTLGLAEGLVLVGGLLAYTLYNLKVGQADPDSVAHELEREATEELHLDQPEPRSRLKLDLAFIVLGLAGLSLGADQLVKGATVLATDVLGVSPGLVGLTVVAFGTSLPELATSLRAALTKQHAMAIGNVVGSNVFNILSVLGISSLVRPLSAREGIGPDLVVMLVAAVLCYPVLSRKRMITRVQGAIMVAGYLGYTVFAFMQEI